MAYNKTVRKYLFKAFYKQIHKKKYKLQILPYNIYHSKIFVIQNTIFLVKVRYKKKQLAIDIDNILIKKIMYIYSATTIFLNYG